MPQLLVFLGLVGFGIALFALIRGHLDWARIRNRKIATVGLVVTFGVMITGSALAAPAPATNTAATTGTSAPLASRIMALPTTTTTIPATTTTDPPTTTTTTTTTNPPATTTTVPTHHATTTVGRPPATHRTTTPPPPAGPALICSASVSNPFPADNSTVDVVVRTGVSGASVTATAHYKTTSTTHSTSAGGNGEATIPFRISRATPGHTVEVDVEVSAGGVSQSCSTSFTPV